MSVGQLLKKASQFCRPEAPLRRTQLTWSTALLSSIELNLIPYVPPCAISLGLSPWKTAWRRTSKRRSHDASPSKSAVPCVEEHLEKRKSPRFSPTGCQCRVASRQTLSDSGGNIRTDGGDGNIEVVLAAVPASVQRLEPTHNAVWTDRDACPDNSTITRHRHRYSRGNETCIVIARLTRPMIRIPVRHASRTQYTMNTLRAASR